jgi:hypothetical protein
MPVDEKVISIAIESFREIITWLQKETPFTHLTTITALDTEAGNTLLYHFWYKQGLIDQGGAARRCEDVSPRWWSSFRERLIMSAR